MHTDAAGLVLLHRSSWASAWPSATIGMNPKDFRLQRFRPSCAVWNTTAPFCALSRWLRRRLHCPNLLVSLHSSTLEPAHIGRIFWPLSTSCMVGQNARDPTPVRKAWQLTGTGCHPECSNFQRIHLASPSPPLGGAPQTSQPLKVLPFLKRTLQRWTCVRKHHLLNLVWIPL